MDKPLLACKLFYVLAFITEALVNHEGAAMQDNVHRARAVFLNIRDLLEFRQWRLCEPNSS